MAKEEAKILIIDDDPAVLTSAKLFLKQKFSYIHILDSPENINKVLSEIDFDIILLDMNYSRGENEGKEGLEWIENIIRKHPDVDIIPITAYGDISLAVETMKLGVRDFITKPWQNEKLYLTISNILSIRKSSQKLGELNKLTGEMSGLEGMVGESPAFSKVIDMAKKVAMTDANVLITGENGTGKSMLARYIHHHSQRNSEPFITVDIGSLKESLFESELFGHKRGAFTDAKEDRTGKMVLAEKGSLFLDEVGNINTLLQSKLLTAIQSGEITPVGSNSSQKVDFRLICATNSDLNDKVSKGEFRQDLLFRINTIEIPLPPLRERADDIEPLSQYYLSMLKKKYNKPQLKIHETVFDHFKSYEWPGNVRELSHVLERAVIMSDDPVLTPQSFPLYVSKNNEEKNTPDDLNLHEMEKSMILKALEKNKGNITRAAKDLGIDRLALYRRLEKYGL